MATGNRSQILGAGPAANDAGTKPKVLVSVALEHQSLLIYPEQDLRQRRDAVLLVFPDGKMLVNRCPDVLLPNSPAMRHLNEEMQRYSRSVQLQRNSPKRRRRPAKQQSLGIGSSASKGSSSNSGGGTGSSGNASPGKTAFEKKKGGCPLA
jgi:hypothetical protein